MRIATYNIAHGADYTRYGTVEEHLLPTDLDKLARVIRALDADVIALNEVYEYGQTEQECQQTDKLAQMLGYPYSHFAIGADLGFCVIGNAVLSRYPVESVDTVAVPAPSPDERPRTEEEWFEDRVVLVCRVLVDGVPLTVAATHFGLNPSEQSRMLTALAPIMAQERPLVLLGDFNVCPNSTVLEPLRACLTDAAAALGTEELTFSSLSPDRRIDYIFLSHELTPIRVHVPPVVCSDHLPVVCDFVIKSEKM